MAGSTKGFKVDPEALLKVANQVQNLLDSMSGAGGAHPGNKDTYSKNAAPEHLASALSMFFDSPAKDAYADAYKYEHEGVLTTMGAMVDQLTTLHTACVTTAQNYQKNDDGSRTDVQKAGQSGGWTP